jgi:ADP-ribose pyrophosphatase YjhB (NUDIX family)
MKSRVRAVIIKDGKILLIKRTKSDLVYWVIPGGGVEMGETNKEALIRECKEELGVDIEVKDLISEIVSKKKETVGQKEYFYLVDILAGTIGSGQGPEFQNNSGYSGQYDIEWIDIKSLSNVDLKPGSIKNLLSEQYVAYKIR